MLRKTILLLTALLFFLCGFGLCVVAGRKLVGSVHSVVVTPIDQDFGEVNQGEKLESVFVLANNGNRPVKIISVYTGCDCADGLLSDRVINAGQKAELKVTWDTSAKRGDSTTHVAVTWSEFGRDEAIETDLQLRALVIPRVLASSDELKFGASTSQQLSVYSGIGAKELQIVNAYSTHKAFSVVVLPGKLRVMIDYDGRAWSEMSSQAHVVIETNDELSPRLRIPLIVDG